MNRPNPMDHWKNALPKFLGDDFFSEFQNLGYNGAATGPKVNMYESGNVIICILSLPELNLDSVDVYAYQKTLEVRGVQQIDYKGYRLIQEEIQQGNFKRTIELPYPVRDDKIEATYKNGMLMIQLHRLIRSNQINNKVNVKNLEEE